MLAKTPPLGVVGNPVKDNKHKNSDHGPLKAPPWPLQGDSRHGYTRNMVTICIIHIGYNKSYHIESILE